jgi:hypothetical protein
MLIAASSELPTVNGLVVLSHSLAVGLAAMAPAAYHTRGSAPPARVPPRSPQNSGAFYHRHDDGSGIQEQNIPVVWIKHCLSQHTYPHAPKIL